jgi:hypothetical protein
MKLVFPITALDVEESRQHAALSVRPGPGGVVVPWTVFSIALHAAPPPDAPDRVPDLTKIIRLPEN